MPRDPNEFMREMELSSQLRSKELSLEIETFYAVLGKAQNLEYEEVYGPKPLEKLTDTSPIRVPVAPPGVDIDKNIRRARISVSPSWFLERLAPKGEMDYKRYDNKLTYENFGNFNYGAVALAYGFNEATALRAAGLVQSIANISSRLESRNSTGTLTSAHEQLFVFLGSPPFGDEEKDQAMIKLGFRYYKEVFFRNTRLKNGLMNTFGY